MRIQNNVTAMNTHRMYTINNDNVAKSAEKLSSGYRINRAGDDAAGLAISEKMRSQIRGLNMATKNSQDAISMVQTAEGALQETHAMLQRMNELAVQAATGTNEDLDRTALAKEFDQLKREINDVAEQTNFNNMILLDGSLSYEGYQRSAATAGVNNTITTSATQTTALTKGYSIEGKDAVTKAAGDATFTPTGTASSTSSGLKSGEFAQIKVTLKDGTTLTSAITQMKGTAGSDIKLDKLFASGTGFENSAIKLYDKDGAEVTGVTATGAATGVVTLAGANTVKQPFDFSDAEISFIRHDNPDTGKDGEAVKTPYETKAVAGTNSGVATPDIAAVAAENEYKVDSSKVKDGDKFTINGKTLQVVTDPKKIDANGMVLDEDGVATKTFAIAWNGKTGDDSDLVANMAKAINTISKTDGTQVTSAADGAPFAAAKDNQTLVVTGFTPAATNDGAKSTTQAKLETVGSNTYAGRTNTVEFDIAKMKDGDTFTIKTTNGGSKSVTFEKGMSRREFMDQVKKDMGELGEVKGNALIIKDDQVESITLQSGLLPETNAIRIQVGALENEQLSVSIDSMNTKGLNLDDASLTVIGGSTTEQQDKAGEAITLTRAAINKVSDQRATLGAMQNRLDHKIANLKVASENLSASESRIRDVDMASEMTNFTKNNILSQAATAMLAQANSLPQNVLSLLG